MNVILLIFIELDGFFGFFSVVRCPNEVSRGVYIWQTLHGNIVCGPTAINQSSKVFSLAEPRTLNQLQEIAISCVPSLQNVRVIGSYSGLRPGTQYSDYQIESIMAKKWIMVGGIRSTGLTGSLGIAKHVSELVGSLDGLRARRQLRQHVCNPLPSLEQLYESFRKRGDGTVVIGNRVHVIAHSLSKFGFASNLLRAKL
jgi:glycerol-3-phosphate dehydrogenase